MGVEGKGGEGRGASRGVVQSLTVGNRSGPATTTSSSHLSPGRDFLLLTGNSGADVELPLVLQGGGDIIDHTRAPSNTYIHTRTQRQTQTETARHTCKLHVATICIIGTTFLAPLIHP